MPRVVRPGAFEMLPWLPTVIGVVIMIGVFLFAVFGLRPSDSGEARAPVAPAATPPLLAGPSLPEDRDTAVATPETPPEPATASPPATSAPPRPRRTTAAPPPAPAPAPPPEVTGRYRVVEAFGDSFVGEVRVANASGRSRDWTVRLRFPANVGGLRTFWVDGAPQPKLQRSGDVFVFTSGAPVGAGKAAQLRFHFDRTGSVSTPSACSVNGVTCTGI